MAIYLSRKKGGSVATPITPSNASPAQMTANVAVNPTRGGYAIENYLDVYPDNDDPVQISSDVVAVFKGAGFAIEDAPITAIPNDNNPPELDEDCIYIIRNNTGYLYETQPATPTNLTPSNSSPATITSGETYKATANGKAISSYSEVAPSNANPPFAIEGNIYKIKTRTGLIIGSASYVSPSDTNPPQLLVNSDFYRINGASGYLYATQQKVKYGTNVTVTSAGTYINCGFKPKYISVIRDGATYVYDETRYTDRVFYATSSNYFTSRVIPNTVYNIRSVDDNGFTFGTSSGNTTINYVAVG